jgi:hypothetical protein
MAETLFANDYNNCSKDEKKQCNENGREAMLATVYNMMKADKGRYPKLLIDLHDNHLKGYSTYPQNIADAQKLLLNYSSNNKQKTEEKREDNNDVSNLAFAQDGSGGGCNSDGYTFTGKCHRCGKEGHRAFQCPDKYNINNNGSNGNSKTAENKTKTAAATTDKVVTEELTAFML